MSAAEYHTDPCDVPALSASIAKTLLAKSPAHAYLEHPKLGAAPREPTKAMDNGSVIDALMLGGWQSKIGIVEANDFKTKAAQEQRDAFRAEGRTPILARDFAESYRVATTLKAKLAVRGYEFRGENQVVLMWEESTICGPVQCRAMLDHAFVDQGIIYDLKTIHTASPDVCGKQTHDLGYHVQRAAYASGLDKLMPKKVFGGPDFVFLFCETEPPYCVTPSRLNGVYRQLGERRWERACETWARCLRDNEWPEYTTGTITLEAPPWAIAREMEQAL